MNLVELAIGLAKLGFKKTVTAFLIRNASDYQTAMLPAQTIAILKRMMTPAIWNLDTNLVTADDGTTFTPANGTMPVSGDNFLMCTGAGVTTQTLDGIVYKTGDYAVFTLSNQTWTHINGNTIPTAAGLLASNGDGTAKIAVAGTDYNAGPVLQRTLSAGQIMSYNFAANGVMSAGQPSGPVSAGTLTSAGSGLTNGTYNGVALTTSNGSGVSATANITVAGGVVTALAIVGGGGGYVPGSQLSAAVANIGGTGTSFVWTVSTVTAPTLTFGATSGNGVSVSGTGFLTGTAADVGKVITLDGGKQATIASQTGISSGTVNISGGVLSSTSIAAWTIFYPVTYGAFDAYFNSEGTWLYFPAGSITATNVAGFYWTVWFNSTYATVYNVVYVPGQTSSSPPSNPAAFNATPGAVTYSSISLPVQTDQYTIPANFLGAQGMQTSKGMLHNSPGSIAKKFYQTMAGATIGLNLGNTTNTTISDDGLIVNTSAKRQLAPVTPKQAATTNAQTHNSADTTAAVVVGASISVGAVTEWAMSSYYVLSITPKA